MWPMRLDMSRDECKKCLRCLELDAYGNMVSVLRAQGPFSSDKQRLLLELAKVLRISNERHRAEVRRAVNDEKLSTIAEQLNGPDTSTDWAIEGRRTIPLLPRLKAHTAFTGLANSLSFATTAANEKKATVSPETIEDVKVKVEAESHGELQLEETEASSIEIVTSHAERHLKNRKRRRSLIEFQDVDAKTIHPNDGSQSLSDDIISTSFIGPKSPSIVPIPSSNKVIIVSSSSALEVPRHNIMDKLADINAVNTSCSTAITSCHPNLSVLPIGSSCAASHSTVPCKTTISQNTTYSLATIQASKLVSTNVSTCMSAHQTGKTRPKLTMRTKVHPKTASIRLPTGVSQQKSAKSAPDIHDAQTGSGPRLVTVTTGSTALSGPGPPHIKSTTAVLTCKKIPAAKTGHRSITKMGITLNSNKTLNITSNPGARMTTKANVIVVQKGPARGVTLSHAGKEVLGKVIMGGKNLCLSNQQSSGGIALLPHRAAVNGEQTLTMLSPVSSTQTEPATTDSKSGNMIVFDLRQEDLEKSKVLSQILEASGVFGTESNLLTKEQHISKATHIKGISFVTEQKDHRKSKDTSVNVNCEQILSTPASKNVESKEIFTGSDDSGETEGTLDPQTGIYSFQSTDDAVDNVRTMEPISDTGIDIFGTALASADINLASFPYTEDEDSNILEEARSPILSIDQLNELYDCQESIVDQSNC